jgi:hypothetical protein
MKNDDAWCIAITDILMEELTMDLLFAAVMFHTTTKLKNTLHNTHQYKQQ